MYLVIFRNRKRPDLDAARYGADAERMATMAAAQPGYLSFKSYTAEDGEVVAVSEWADKSAARAWGRNADHTVVQAMGRAEYYADYTLFGCDAPRMHRFGGHSTEVAVSTILYGIPNCDTVKKARAWLGQHGIANTFHDYKKSGIDRATLMGWVDRLGWEVVLNRTGTTFRKLPEAERSDLDGDKAIGLMLGQPSMIKRPVVAHSGGLLIGFKPEEWALALT